jgi:hypothetical protein
VEAIRQLHLARASAVQARATAMHQLAELVVTSPTPVRAALTSTSRVARRTNRRRHRR